MVCFYLVTIHVHVPGLTSGLTGGVPLAFTNSNCSGHCTCNDDLCNVYKAMLAFLQLPYNHSLKVV